MTRCGRSNFPRRRSCLSPPIIAVDGVSVGYEPGRPVLRGLTLRIDDDDRIALLGANGNGKSTLVKLLAGRLAPMSGQVTRAQKLDIGYFAQHQLDELDGADSAYAHLRRLMPDAPEARVRARAGAMGFSAAMADTPAAQLSGGEKARLLLGLATFAGPHLVMLDEPTNHLDIDSRSALIAAHQRLSRRGDSGLARPLPDRGVRRPAVARRATARSYRSTATSTTTAGRFWGSAAGRGRNRRPAQGREPPRPTRADIRRSAAEKRHELAPLGAEITGLESNIAHITAEIARLDSALAEPGLFARDPAKAAALAKIARRQRDRAHARRRTGWSERGLRSRDDVSGAIRYRWASLRGRGFWPFGRGRRPGQPLDREQPPAGESVDARPGPAREGQRHGALSALVGAEIDLFGGACASHHVALGHLQHDSALDRRRPRRQHGFPGGRPRPAPARPRIARRDRPDPSAPPDAA